MENLLTWHGQHAGEDALGEASAKHNAVVGLLHDKINEKDLDLKQNHNIKINW